MINNNFCLQMSFIPINNENTHYLENFLKNKIPQTFRYFQKRSTDTIQNHILTIILLVDKKEIGYAHIDFENDKHWFGICLLSEYQGKGYGKKMMNFVFNHPNIKKLDNVYLSVDKNNLNAIELYKLFDFNIIFEKDTYYLMMKNINNSNSV